MKISNKYEIMQNRLVNIDSGEAIPDDEPLFLIRGRDPLAKKAIAYIRYLYTVNDIPQVKIDGVTERVEAVRGFHESNPSRVQLPGALASSPIAPEELKRLLSEIDFKGAIPKVAPVRPKE